MNNPGLHCWIGEHHDAHVTDYRNGEADRANTWFAGLQRKWDEMGVMIICTCGKWTFPRMARTFAHEHWASCGINK